jgi:hypothetical protein
MAVGDRYIPMSFYDSLEDARRTLRENSLLALELQTDVLHWMGSAHSQATYRQFMKSYGYRKLVGNPNTDQQASWLHRRVQDVLTEASTYYCSPDMAELIKMAADAMPSEGLHESDLPSESGFLLFARPVFIEGPDAKEGDEEQGLISASEGPIPVTAIAWKKGEVRRADDKGLSPGISYFLFMSPHDVAAVSNQGALRESLAAANAAGLDTPEPHLLANGMTEQEARDMVGPLSIYDFSGWTFGQAWNRVPWGSPDSIGLNEDGTIHKVYPVVDQARRLMLATWKMLNERVTVVDSERPPRAMLRRASRFIPDAGDVLVIRLRKEHHPGRIDDGEEPVEQWWTHRWLVRGFWRRPPGSAPDARQTVWVNPYIKGDPSLPLIVKEKIYSLER